MPSVISVFGYKVYFWSNENHEPVHVHISKGRPSADATKVWITKKGGCIIENNNSNIPKNDLNKLLDVIATNYFVIINEWKNMFLDEEILFYC